MRVIYTSNLANIKTVFNSDSDNEQYYRRLRAVECHKFDNVELARPIIRKASIIWKSETNLELKPFTDLSEDYQISLSFKLQEFFELFKNKISSFKNIPPNFAEQVIQIPNRNSLLVNEENNYIVIINWGYLEDSFDRKEGVISQMFSEKPRSSILIKALNKKSNPIVGANIKIDSSTVREFNTTDDSGYARFGVLEQGDKFSVYESKSTEDVYIKDFTCDNRSEYTVVLEREVRIGLQFKDTNGAPYPNEAYLLQTNQFGQKTIKTNQNGEYFFTLNVAEDQFNVFDDASNKLLSKEIPDNDKVYEIIIENEVVEVVPPVQPIVEDENNYTTFKVLNSFNRPIKNLELNFTDSEGVNYNGRTDSNGELSINNLTQENLTYSFTRYKRLWKQDINISKGNYHIIKVRSIFPWFWWILIALLLALLLCCYKSNCFCNTEDSSINEEKNVLVKSPTLTPGQLVDLEEKEAISCNTERESGGKGVTLNKHYLGNTPGVVHIYYDMMDIPDKLEVFYENNLVASTYDVVYNVDGFVGGDYKTGCCGVISFKYTPNSEDYCVIRITGPHNTAWVYQINCPE